MPKKNLAELDFIGTVQGAAQMLPEILAAANFNPMPLDLGVVVNPKLSNREINLQDPLIKEILGQHIISDRYLYELIRRREALSAQG